MRPGDEAKVIARWSSPAFDYRLLDSGEVEISDPGEDRWEQAEDDEGLFMPFLADAVRRLSERIEANEAEIAKTELKNTCEYGALRDRVKSLEEGEKDAITNQTGFADQLVALSERIDVVEHKGSCDAGTLGGLLDLAKEADRQFDRRIEKLEAEQMKSTSGQLLDRLPRALDRLARLESRSYRANERIDELREEMSQGYGVHEVQLDLLAERIEAVEEHGQSDARRIEALRRAALVDLAERVAALEVASEKLREAGMNNTQGSEALVAFTDKLDDRVAALEERLATSPRDDALIQPNDEATRDYIRHKMTREIARDLRAGSNRVFAAWIEKKYLREPEGEEGGGV